MKTFYIIILMQFLCLPNAVCQGKLQLKKGKQTKTIKAGDAVVLLDKYNTDLEPRVRIHAIIEEGFVFIGVIDSCKNDTIKRRRMPNRLKKKGWDVVKAYGAIGDSRINFALCYPLSYTLDTIPFTAITTIKKWKRPYTKRDDSAEVLVLGTSLLAVLISPLTGLSKKGYKGKVVGITAGTGVAIGLGTLLELYLKKRPFEYQLDEWEINKIKTR